MLDFRFWLWAEEISCVVPGYVSSPISVTHNLSGWYQWLIDHRVERLFPALSADWIVRKAF
jgi:hypothetical protein